MNRTKRMCEEAAIAALYVAVCVTLSPISFGVVQFRIANILCALPLLNKRYVRPILLGVAFANMMSPFGVVDVAFGVLAEGTAYLVCVFGKLKNVPMMVRQQICALLITVVISAELYIVAKAPIAITAAGLFISTSITLFAGVWIATKTPLKRIL